MATGAAQLGHERPPELELRGPVGLCTCGHRAYRHARRKAPSSPRWDLTACRVINCRCAGYENADGTDWPFGVGP